MLSLYESSHKVWELLGLTWAKSLLNSFDISEYFDIVPDLFEFYVISMFPPEIKIDPVFCDNIDAWKAAILKLPNWTALLCGYPFKSIKCSTLYPV